MKNENIFLTWSRSHSYDKQFDVVFNWIIAFGITMLLIGIWLAYHFAFDMGRLLFPIVIACIIVAHPLKNYFFQEKCIVRRQLKYLSQKKEEILSLDDVDEERAKEYALINEAIEHLQYQQSAVLL